MNRRELLLGGAALIAGAAVGAPARAAIARAFDQDLGRRSTAATPSSPG